MMASLEWGCFDYARGVLDNWLTYFIKDKGFVLYRGLEMAQHGRMLTNIAQCASIQIVVVPRLADASVTCVVPADYKYTGDGALLPRQD